MRKSPRPPRPKHLYNEGAVFWDKYSPLCHEMGTLRAADVPSFTLLCELWQRKCDSSANDEDTIKYVCLVKQIEARMKAHGLTPESRKKLGIDDDDTPETDEYGVPK